MKVAIPLFVNRISPRFDYAQRFLVVQTANGEIKEREEFQANEWSPFERIRKLVDIAVRVVICGGINGFSAQQLGFHKITIISGVCGETERILQLFLKGRLPQKMMSVSGAVFDGYRCFRGGKGLRRRRPWTD